MKLTYQGLVNNLIGTGWHISRKTDLSSEEIDFYYKDKLIFYIASNQYGELFINNYDGALPVGAVKSYANVLSSACLYINDNSKKVSNKTKFVDSFLGKYDATNVANGYLLEIDNVLYLLAYSEPRQENAIYYLIDTQLGKVEATATNLEDLAKVFWDNYGDKTLDHVGATYSSLEGYVGNRCEDY